jgi:hypothetical protein
MTNHDECITFDSHKNHIDSSRFSRNTISKYKTYNINYDTYENKK